MGYALIYSMETTINNQKVKESKMKLKIREGMIYDEDGKNLGHKRMFSIEGKKVYSSCKLVGELESIPEEIPRKKPCLNVKDNPFARCNNPAKGTIRSSKEKSPKTIVVPGYDFGASMDYS